MLLNKEYFKAKKLGVFEKIFLIIFLIIKILDEKIYGNVQ